MLASTFASLLQSRLRDAPEHETTTIAVAGPGGFYDIVQLHFSPDHNELWIDIVQRESRRGTS